MWQVANKPPVLLLYQIIVNSFLGPSRLLQLLCTLQARLIQMSSPGLSPSIYLLRLFAFRFKPLFRKKNMSSFDFQLKIKSISPSLPTPASWWYWVGCPCGKQRPLTHTPGTGLRRWSGACRGRAHSSGWKWNTCNGSCPGQSSASSALHSRTYQLDVQVVIVLFSEIKTCVKCLEYLKHSGWLP